jgi:hypothetical protein
MLETIFLLCAVVGGTVMVCQLVMTLLGASHDGAGDLHGDMHGDLGADHVSFDGDSSAGSHDIGHHHDTSWLFGVISFRTIVAALTFFGLGGYAAFSAGQGEAISLGIALVCGIAAMYGVYALMLAVYRLQSTGTQNIKNAVGQRGSVLVPIPPNEGGIGKIHVAMQGRLVELSAMTGHAEKLPTGARIEVVEVLGPATVRIVPIVETEDVDRETNSSETSAQTD